MEQNNQNTAVFTQGTIVEQGVEKCVVSGMANTGHPQYNVYTPGYNTTSGAGYVDPKVSTTLFFRTAEGETVKVRANFWGESAEDAKLALVDSDRVATLQITNARLRTYTDRFGVERQSININYRSQYAGVKLEQHGARPGFAQAMAAQPQINEADIWEGEAPF